MAKERKDLPEKKKGEQTPREAAEMDRATVHRDVERREGREQGPAGEGEESGEKTRR